MGDAAVKGLPAIPAALLAKQPPAVRAQLAAAGKRRAPSKRIPVGAVVAILPDPHRATVDADGTVRAEIPLILPSLANLRGDWTKAKAVRRARLAVYDVEVFGNRLAGIRGALAGVPVPPLPLRVTITRCAPRPIRDTFENLPCALKGAVDSVALWCGVDDSDPRVVYIAAQEKGRGTVRIVVESVNPPTLADVPPAEVKSCSG